MKPLPLGYPQTSSHNVSHTNKTKCTYQLNVNNCFQTIASSTICLDVFRFFIRNNTFVFHYKDHVQSCSYNVAHKQPTTTGDLLILILTVGHHIKATNQRSTLIAGTFFSPRYHRNYFIFKLKAI